jgi:hypothetical protein
MVYSKICSICESKFSTTYSRKKYCTPICAEKADKLCKKVYDRKKSEEYKEKNKKIRLCKHCHSEFKLFFLNSDRQKFCSDQCKVDHHKDIKLERLREQADLSPKPCLHCEELFSPKYGTNTSRQVHCSALCKKEYHKSESKRKTAEIRANTIKTCPICDVKFSPKKTLKEIYCSKQCRQTIGKRVYGMMERCYKEFNTDKKNKSHKVLGYSPAELLAHLQSFPDWDTLKHQKWHLDHKFPIIAFVHKGITDISIICQLDNLQPLSEEDNCSKNGTYDLIEFEKFTYHTFQ